ncbi:MAG: type III-B CRISPR module RAMP protein Cmr6 [Candidatus Sericytochromatia bacterium]
MTEHEIDTPAADADLDTAPVAETAVASEPVESPAVSETEGLTASENEVPAEAPVAARRSKGKSDKAKSDKGEGKRPQQRNADGRSVGFIALPVSTSQLIKKHGVTHPGLVLNKYAVLLRLQDKRLQYEWNPEQKKRLFQKVQHLLANTPELKNEWEQRLAERQALLTAQNALQLSLNLTSPLVVSLHHPFAELGVELHPIAGFPYLSASHIKGALRQFVNEHWLPTQDDATAAKARIAQVFGSPGRDHDEGAICFHDAWPENWPALLLELTSNHHVPYYGRQQAPGDWQTPDPHYYLALKPGTRMGFALTRRRPDVPNELMQQVSAWLQEMLGSHGIGAYRQLGLGRFRTAHAPQTPAWQTTLALYSPAFLSGVSQRQDDCRLRPSTLRGLLRWWWRTLHSGFLSPRELLSLESLIWGSGRRKGAVRLHLDAPQGVQARRYRPEDLLRVLPSPEGERRSPGLTYLGYGLLSDSSKRYFMGSDARWSLSVDTREVVWRRKDESVSLSAEMILQQVQAALWLLCHYGGVGQRKRKGFGSLQELDMPELNEDRCLEWAAALREHCQLNTGFEDSRAESPSLMQRIELSDLATPWTNPWFALHQLGESLQSYMQQHKHEAIKQALGLPRTMDPPINGDLELPSVVGQRHAAPYFLHLTRDAESKLVIRTVAFPAAKLPNAEQSQQILTDLMRHLRTDLQARVVRWAQEPRLDGPAPQAAAPRRRPQGEGVAAASGEKGAKRPPARVFTPRPPGEVPQAKPRSERAPGRGPGADRDRPRRPRAEGERREGAAFEGRKDREWPPRDGGGGDRSKRPGGRSAAPAVNKSGLPQAGDWIEAVLLEERTKKGGWRAQHPATKLAGPLLNSGNVAGDAEAGTPVTLIVHASNKFEMSFRWPTEAELEKREKSAVRSKK